VNVLLMGLKTPWSWPWAIPGPLAREPFFLVDVVVDGTALALELILLLLLLLLLVDVLGVCPLLPPVVNDGRLVLKLMVVLEDVGTGIDVEKSGNGRELDPAMVVFVGN